MEDRRTEKRITGDAGEDAACGILINEGYIILQRNFSCRIGEIDIVALNEDEGILAFVEVRTRRDTKFGLPCETVGRQKQYRLKRSAELFLLIHEDLKRFQPMMDIIEILYTNEGVFGRHLRNAF